MLKPCPFCGSPAVISGVLLPGKFTRDDSKIPPTAKRGSVSIVYNRKLYRYREVAYCAQCSKKSCIGRLYKHFPTKEAAEAAWNERSTVNGV